MVTNVDRKIIRKEVEIKRQKKKKRSDNKKEKIYNYLVKLVKILDKKHLIIGRVLNMPLKELLSSFTSSRNYR